MGGVLGFVEGMGFCGFGLRGVGCEPQAVVWLCGVSGFVEGMGSCDFGFGEWSASRKPRDASRYSNEILASYPPSRVSHSTAHPEAARLNHHNNPLNPLPISQRLAFHSPEIEATKPLITTIPRNHPRIPRLAGSTVPRSHALCEPRAVMTTKSLQELPPSHVSHSTAYPEAAKLSHHNNPLKPAPN